MRYDTPIYFVKVTRGDYNADTGDYETDTPVETKQYASVYGTHANTMQIVYGHIQQGSLTIHLQNHYKDVFDYIRIGDKKYRVDYHQSMRIKDGYIVTEMQ